MFKNTMRPVHPGEVLQEDYLKPLNMSADALAMALQVPASLIGDILLKRCGVSADTAPRPARYFGGQPEDAQGWLNMQAAYDLKADLHANASIAAAKRDGGGVPSEAVIAGLEAKLAAARLLELKEMTVAKKRDPALVAPLVKGAPLPKDLPESNVANFVMAFAELNGVKPTRTRLDLFAEAVTRLSGDDVRLDEVGQTLVALAKRKLISGDEMTKLLHSHILERNRGQAAQ